MQAASLFVSEFPSVLSQLSTVSFSVHAILGALAIWVFSWLWHDFIIVNPWLRWTGMSLEQAQSLHKGKLVQDLGLYLMSKLLLSYSCMLVAIVLQVQTITQALCLSSAISVGIVFPAGVGPVIFENRNVGLWLLSSSLISISVLVLLIVQLV